MNDDEARQALAEAVEVALDAAYHYSSYRWPQQQDCPRIADALLPVMRHLAAEELRAAAEEWRRFPHTYRADRLDLCAAALDATPDHGKA